MVQKILRVTLCTPFINELSFFEDLGTKSRKTLRDKAQEGWGTYGKRDQSLELWGTATHQK